MITTRKELKRVLKIERSIYCEYMFPSKSRQFMAMIKQETPYLIMKWQLLSRKADYYNYRVKSYGYLLDKVLYLYYICKRNRIGNSLGLELGTFNIKEGLLIYHMNNVINGWSIVGKNLHLHGNNVIGNIGPEDPSGCPTIGDNVMLGAGAKIIGRVIIADDIKVAAGAVVVNSFLESGITIAGVPAKKVSK